MSRIPYAFLGTVLFFSASRAFGQGSEAQVRALLDASRYDEAKRQLAQVPRTGASAELDVLDARLALVTGHYDEAIRLARAVGKTGSLGRSAVPIAAEALARTGKHDEAIRELEPLNTDDQAHRAHVLKGQLLIGAGRRDEAELVLMKVIDAYNDDRITATDAEGLALAGRAAFLMRQAKDANRLYTLAEDACSKKSVELLRWRAELFVDKYDPGHAAEAVNEALKIAPNDPLLHVMAAHVKLEQTMDFSAAESEVTAALAVDPKLAEAYFVRAGLALRTLDLEAADHSVQAGLAVDPLNLDLLSVQAAARFLADDANGVAALKHKVLALNPSFARFFTVVGEFAEWEHRYSDIVTLMREAVRVDSKDAKAYAALGLNLIRDGNDDEGLMALQQSFERDDFNVRVYNTLNFYQNTVSKNYVSVDGGHFRIRYHKDEKPVLERYVPQLLEQARSSMVARYGFTPAAPIGVELYADAEHFSVRTSGLPNVGIQGVCFGKTLAALSPGAGSFNWGMIVWHELSHVFHIQQSKSHVPRWFTEGLAEYETILARPEWRREEEPSLFSGMRDKKVPPVADFNRAFTHVDSPLDVVMAYFAASQIQVFAGERFGFEKFPQMLKGWAAGKRTPELFREVYGVESVEFDRLYGEWQAARLQRYTKQFMPAADAPSVEVARASLVANPGSASKHVVLARALLLAGQADEAEATLALALGLDSKEPNGLFLQLKLALGRHKLDLAGKLVERLLAAGHDGYAVRMKAADIAEAKEDRDAMRRELFAAHELDPSQAEPLQAIHDLARKRKDQEEQLFALRQLTKLDQHDRRVWRKLLAMLVERGQWQEAVGVGEAAMFVDVMTPETHFLYARALARTGRSKTAIFELNSALHARPGPDLARKIYAMMAEGYRKLGKPAFADAADGFSKALPATKRDASSEVEEE